MATTQWDSGEKSLSRDSFNAIVARKQANVSEMMIGANTIGRKAELGPDWSPAALHTIARAQRGQLSQTNKQVPGLGTQRAAGVMTQAVHQTGFGFEDHLGWTAGNWKYDPTQSMRSSDPVTQARRDFSTIRQQEPTSPMMSMSMSSPNLRGAPGATAPPGASWPGMRRAQTALQSAGAGVTRNASRGNVHEQVLWSNEDAEAAGVSFKPPDLPPPRSAPAHAESTTPLGGTIHWRPNEQTLNRDSFNKIVARSRFDPTESMMRDSNMSRMAMLGPSYMPAGMQTRAAASQVSPAYHKVPFAGKVL